jgi:hypothetical protein
MDEVKTSPQQPRLADRLAVRGERAARRMRTVKRERAAFRADQRDAAGFGFLMRQGR